MDAQLVEKIVHEVKSQGVFDEFRKDSIADVDTKPAYQNLRQRVENTVKKFLSEQKWSLETNKNQLREKLRRHITESGFLDVGVERIVDQVVNPKIGSVFQPRIEEIAYKYLGLPPPPKKFEPPPPPLMHPLPPLPLNAPPLKIETSSLLPTDLEQVSPDSDNTTVKSECKDDRTAVDMDTEEKLIEDEDESPPFEPLVKYEVQETKVDIQKEGNIKQELVAALNEKANKFGNNYDTSIKTENFDSNNEKLVGSTFATECRDVFKETSQSVDARISQDSQLSSVSSDSRLSTNVKEESLQSSSEEAVAANISEEAQMPKFNENSCEPNAANGNVYERHDLKSVLHFDIKKDEIKFEGTERKTGLETFDSVAGKTEDDRYLQVEENNSLENKKESFVFVANNLSTEIQEDDGERTPNAQELSFGSSVDDSSSVTPTETQKNSNISKEKEEIQPQTYAPIQITRPTSPIVTPGSPTFLRTPIPSPVALQKSGRDTHHRYSSSSASKHKKHSKERSKSYEREKERYNKERHRSGKDSKDSSKYYSNSGTKSSSKNSSASSSSKFYSSHSKSIDKDIEKYSSSSSKQTKHSHSHSSSSSNENQESKKSKRDSGRRHHSSSSKRNERKDDHAEAKKKSQRRKSTDSNDDEDGSKGMGGSKSGSHYKSSGSSYRSKSSKSSENNKSSSYKTNECQKDEMQTKEYHEGFCSNSKHVNNVVILNDILENPQTQFIQLNSHGHLVEKPVSQQSAATKTERSEFVPIEFNNNVELDSFEEKHNIEDIEACSMEKQKLEENEACCKDLLYFEETQLNISDRLNLLNVTMDLCRCAVNSLRFDSLSDEGIELSNEEDVNSDNNKIHLLIENLKRRSEYNHEEFVTTPRKRFISNDSEGCQSKTSPTPSDTSSINSKENEEFYKSTNHAKKSLLDHHKAIQKLSQQQRYSSEDLYKPRPILGQRSRRRGMDQLV